MANVLHSSTAHVTNGREGRATTPDGVLDVALARPGMIVADAGTTPEALFGAAYAACFSSALGRIRREAHFPTVIIEADCDVALAERPTGGFGLTVDLAVTIPDTSADDAVTQARAAHELCPYSNAVKGNVPVRITANGATAVEPS